MRLSTEETNASEHGFLQALLMMFGGDFDTEALLETFHVPGETYECLTAVDADGRKSVSLTLPQLGLELATSDDLLYWIRLTTDPHSHRGHCFVPLAADLKPNATRDSVLKALGEPLKSGAGGSLLYHWDDTYADFAFRRGRLVEILITATPIG